ncbi:MAG: 30S ribosomal protein S20 [Clostridiaceae bacterium]|nr:30S ribosomal protein S20 [Clostridiaceae bacterium]
MPNIKSAIKRVRSDEKKTLANKMKRSQTRTMLRKAYRAIREGDPNAAVLAKEAIATVDLAASQGRIHRNAASRHKSRLTRQVNALEAQA